MNNEIPPRAPHAQSDEKPDLSALLQALPREQASLGFEERVLRRVRAEPTPPMTLARGLRLSTPLLAAAALGFLFGPTLLDRGSSDPTRGQVQEASGQLEQLDPSPYGPSGARLGQPLPPATLPQAGGLTNRGQAQVVAMPGAVRPASALPAADSPSFSVPSRERMQQIRAQADRVKIQLEELRRARDAAGATVSMTLQDGVEVQVDLRELQAELERRAAEVQAQQKLLAAQQQKALAAQVRGSGDQSAPEPQKVADPPVRQHWY